MHCDATEVEMSLGPIEVLEIAFPGNRFNGEILPELERLVESKTISIVDGLFVRKDGDGEVEFYELSEVGADESVNRLAGLLDEVESLLSDDDVAELAAGLEPDSSAAILVFEHTWAKPFRDAIVGSGGVLAANFRVPGMVIDELLDELAALDDDNTDTTN
ncbi:MAG: hypothetical protein CL424_18650 [Acidimicrobiaceae bacterium]|nr:hypothetical protein [Acidimicrobiaceae bacterium]